MNKGLKHRMNAAADCSNGIGQAIAMLLFNVIRLPFAIAFGWPDPTQDAMDRQQLLHMQYRDLEAKAEASAKLPAASGD